MTEAVFPTSPRQFRAAMEQADIPGIEQVRDDVWALPQPFGPGLEGAAIRYSIAYVYRDGRGDIHLIDPGTPSTDNFDSLERALSGIGASLRDVATVSVTHHHGDHFGLAPRIHEASGAIVQMGGPDARAVGAGEQARRPDVMRDQCERWGVPQQETSAMVGLRRPPGTPFDAARKLDDGEGLGIAGRDVVAIATPGHTLGHMVFCDHDDKLLFTGDHLHSTLGTSLNALAGEGAGVMGAYLSSLADLDELGDYEVLPGHEFRFRGLRARLAQVWRHLESRSNEISRIMAAHPSASVWDIAQLVPWSGGLSARRGIKLYSTLQSVSIHHDYIADRGVITSGY